MLRCRPAPPVRIEHVRLIPEHRRSMQVPDGDEEVRTLQNLDVLVLEPAVEEGCLREHIWLERAADKDGRFRVEAQRLRDDKAHLLEAAHVVVGRGAALEHAVDLLLHLRLRLRVLRQQPRGPREHRACGLVSGDEERDEVIAQLLLRRVAAAHVHQEPEQGGVFDVGVVLCYERVQVCLLLLVDHVEDELVEHAVQQLHVLLELPLSRNQRRDRPLRTQPRDLPVWEVERRPMLRLTQRS
mmetsp:Transcript_31881/g.76113  ORF Transcript_31881/g.76113 Transcript_31881/m.76113 type:complete len:241 (+) Transcript_31881:732-1454(+)